MVFSDQKEVTAAQQKESFINWINGTKELRENKGKALERNQMVLPFEHHFDFHIAQDFFLNVSGRRHTLQLNFDILNVGNLFKKSWGLYNTTSGGYDMAPVVYKGGTYQFTEANTRLSYQDLLSRWHAQIGLRYMF